MELKGRIILPNDYKIKETFKGETEDKEIKFPKGLGAEHPFSFEDAEEIYKKYGLVSGFVNRLAESIVADFTIKLKNRNSQALIDDFIHTTQFNTKILTWVKEAVLKGNGFIEIDLDEQNIRVMNANHMYVKRDKKGKVIEYVQYTGKLKVFDRNSNKLIPFKPNQIAHLTFNKIPNDPYGIGYVYQNESVLTNLVENKKNVHDIIKRKAGAPYHFKVGQPGEAVSEDVVSQVKTDLQYLTNKTEWVTDGNVDIKMLTASDLGKNHIDLLMYDFREFLAGTGMSEVLMGSGQLNEGIAKVQQEAWQRFVRSLQLIVQETIEEKIIRPILRANNLDEQPQFIWDLPGEEEINNRLLKLTELLRTMGISSILKSAVEIEIARLLEIEGIEDILQTPQEAKNEAEKNKEELEKKLNPERQEEEEIQQPEVPGAKPTAKQSLKEFEEETIKEWINLKEISGFNYIDYLTHILLVLGKDKFEMLMATNDLDITNGLLPRKDIEKLRIIMKDGFKNNRTIREIEKNINDNIKLKDRLVDGKINITAGNRANMIARTESVRLANEGLVNLYKENKIEKVRFLAALSDRTCQICEGLNGQVFDINQLNMGISQPPIHSNCRCSLISIIE